MEIEKSKNINLKLSPQHVKAIRTICQKTGESQTDFFRRLIENELAQIEGRHEDINGSVQTITDKKLDYLIAALNDVGSKTDRNLNAINRNLDAVNQNFSAISYVFKMLLAARYFITRLFYPLHNFNHEELKKNSHEAEDIATNMMPAFYNTVLQDHKKVIQIMKTSNK